MRDSSSKAAAADLVRWVDGVPLAVELLASRVRLLAVDELASSLGQRFDLLSIKRPMSNETLGTMLDEAWAGLDEEGTRAMEACAVFRDGGTPAALVDVLGSADVDALRGLEQLLQRHLVRMTDARDGTPRFTVLRCVREHAERRLDGSGHAEQLSLAHARHYLAQAERRLLGSTRSVDGRAWYHRERANLHAAVERSVASAPELAARLALVLLESPFGVGDGGTRDWLIESATTATEHRAQTHGRDLLWARARRARATAYLQRRATEAAREELLAALDVAGAHSPVDRLRLEDALLSVLAAHAPDQVEPTARDALERARAVEERDLEARFLLHLGRSRVAQSDPDGALALYREGLDRIAASEEPRLEADLTRALAEALVAQGRIGEAAGCFDRALRAYRDVGDLDLEAEAAEGLARIELDAGRVEAGVRLYQRASRLRADDAAERDGVAGALGAALHEAGRPREAQAHLEGALRTGGDDLYARVHLAAVRTRLGDVAPAEALLAALDREAGTMSRPPAAALRTMLLGFVHLARASLLASADEPAAARHLGAARGYLDAMLRIERVGALFEERQAVRLLARALHLGR